MKDLPFDYLMSLRDRLLTKFDENVSSRFVGLVTVALTFEGLLEDAAKEDLDGLTSPHLKRELLAQAIMPTIKQLLGELMSSRARAMRVILDEANVTDAHRLACQDLLVEVVCATPLGLPDDLKKEIAPIVGDATYGMFSSLLTTGRFDAMQRTPPTRQ